jgi:hypothetical protein
VYIGRTQLCVSLWCTYDTGECREQLEEKSQNEQDETVHGPRKGAIGRWFTPSPALRSTKFGTQCEEVPDIPGALLDIIVERIGIALLEIPQGGCTFHHFPNTQDHHPDQVESIGKSNGEYRKIKRPFPPTTALPRAGAGSHTPRCTPWRTVLAMIGMADKPEELVEKLLISLD